MCLKKFELVVVRLSGGLGNQMFQYAKGLLLSRDLGIPLELDNYILEDYIRNKMYSKRIFELKIFDLDYKFFISNFLFNIPNRGLLYRLISDVRRKFLCLENLHDFEEPKSKNLYLNGYFQDNKELLLNQDFLKKTFKLKLSSGQSKISSKGEYFLNKISSLNSIGIHVRRGDYLNVQSLQTHLICGLEYFFYGISFFQNEVENPIFFIFSDDPLWCKQNFIGNFTVEFVETSIIEEDFYLMMNCKHNIISNSTFSWWAAFLNDNCGQKVVCPRVWFVNDEEIVIPEKWIKL